jgi:uncharacterized damage-inducible protein DinB
MFTTIKDFKKSWRQEVEATGKIFSALTEEVLDKKFIEGYWTLGEIAWHIVKTIPEMMNRTGFSIEAPCDYKSLEKKPSEILKAYHKVAEKLIEQVEENWTDAVLSEEYNMYGEMWKKGETLLVLIVHQTHHRGQMTVLMRQAGLMVPGVYGPSKEEWVKYGMEVPAV